MLFVNNFYQSASDEQRARHLPDVCSGRRIGGMCMSEPSVGTDVLGMRTTAARKGDVYLLNGAKMWITNGAVSDTELGDVFLVYARTGDKGTRALSLFIVEKGFPGFRLGQKLKDKLGMRASTTAELVFDQCEVPAANLIGREGDAVGHMMRNLEIERMTLAAMSLGIARRSIEIMNRYASERQAFGQPIREFGQIQSHLATSYAAWMAGRSYVYNTAAHLDLESGGHRIDSDGVKLYCSTMGKEVADRAIQVLGGYGYVGEYQVERLWRDAKLLEIGGGTIEAHQKNLARDLARASTLP
jgi:isovaleryl-CoA dehydrogenase